MKKSRLLALVLTALMALAVLAGCGGGQSTGLQAIKDRGTIRIGVFSDKPPFGYVDENGQNQGYDVYLAKRLAKDLLGDESKVEFVLVEAASRVEYLQSGKVDIILANFTVTPERAEAVDFCNPYMKVALGVVSPDGAVISDMSQLKGKKVIVNKGTTGETYMTENYPDIELLKYDQNTEAFNALKDGRGDALVHDNTLLFAWVRENAGFKVGIGSMGNIDTIAPAVQKGNTELKDWINNELAELGKENFMHENFNQTLKPAYGDTVNPEDVVVEGGVIK